MLLVIHIAIAIISVVFSTFIVIRPTRRRVAVSNGMIGLTLVSGVTLVFQGASVLSLCVSGLMYTVIAVSLTGFARHRLRTATVS